VLKKRVVLLINNESLCGRDFADNKTFFEACGVTVGMSFKEDFQVTHCVRADLIRQMMDKSLVGTPAFPDTVLLIDEVDSIVVDGVPLDYRVEPVEGTGLLEAFTAVKNGAGKPAHVSAEDWTTAQDAKRRADALLRKPMGSPKGWRIKEKCYYQCDDLGRIDGYVHSCE